VSQLLSLTPVDAPAFTIGQTPLYSRVMLAPMAGVTDVVFRQLVRQWAPTALVCTEMISSNGLVYQRRAKKPQAAYILNSTDTDHPIAYQLAAHKPDVLLEAAEAILADHQPVSIDLNMGCPVKKITGNFEGCALMKEPELAAILVKTLTDRLPVPVTVKFRLGWDANTMNYLDFGKRLQDAGAQMVTLHARTRSQGYAPGCKWEAFGELKQALSIPVIANGDINTAEEAAHIINTYGVDGVMIGRAALGRPWLIGQIDTALTTGQTVAPPPLAQQFALAIEHAQRYVQARYQSDGLTEEAAMRDMRKHLAWYAHDFNGASHCRRALTQVNTIADVVTIFEDILATLATTLPHTTLPHLTPQAIDREAWHAA
jgi:tRNA-dihydrouridine synthase B